MPTLHDKIVGNADKIRDPKVEATLKDYQEIPKEALIASKALTDMYIFLGRPQTPFSRNGNKLMEIIISIWQDLYPLEARAWLEERSGHLLSEMSTQEQVHRHTGRSLASFPWPVYQMMKRLFPMFKPQERNDCIKMIKKWPIFRMVNKI